MKIHGATCMNSRGSRPGDAATLRPKTTVTNVVTNHPDETAASHKPWSHATSSGPSSTSPKNATQPNAPIIIKPPNRLIHSAYCALTFLPARPRCSTPAISTASASAGGAARSLKPE
jgi:hypothetical protein